MHLLRMIAEVIMRKHGTMVLIGLKKRKECALSKGKNLASENTLLVDDYFSLVTVQCKGQSL